MNDTRNPVSDEPAGVTALRPFKPLILVVDDEFCDIIHHARKGNPSPPQAALLGCGEVQPLFNALDAIALPVKARLHDDQIAVHVDEAFLYQRKTRLDGGQTHANFAHVLLDVGDVAANCTQVFDDRILDVLGHQSISLQGSLTQNNHPALP